jgi:hypothetical protein
MSTIPFPGSNDTLSNKLPEGIVTGSRKRKQAFSLQDPYNIELQRLATQAARKKAKLSKPSVSSLGRQASVEDIEEDAHSRVFPKNPRNIIECDDDEDIATQAAEKKATISKTATRKPRNIPAPKSNRQASVEDVQYVDNNLPRLFPRNPKNIIEASDDDEDEVDRQPRKPSRKSKVKRQALVEVIDDIDDHQPRVFPQNPRNIIESDDDHDADPDPPEKPAESAEAELSK